MIKLALTTCVIACAGCVASTGSKRDEEPRQELQNERMTTIAAAKNADKAAGRNDGITASATVAYWMGMKAALHPAPIDSEVASKDLGKLSTQGVDPELLRQGQLIAAKMHAAADSIDSMPVVTILLRIPWSRWLEAEALSKAAIEQCRVVERMRPELADRYGVEFPPLDVPRP